MHEKSYENVAQKMTKASKEATVEMNKSQLKIKSSDTLKTNGPHGPPLQQFSLQGNQLCSSILIGNYNYLTQLEVSENEMAILDLRSLVHLETLKCSHNKLEELMINGSNLNSLVGDHNGLRTISVSLTPTKLTFLDISHNYFTELPTWTASCCNLLTLNASHNHLQTVAEFFSTYKINALRILNIGYNNVRILGKLPEKFASVVHLHLQSNELQSLPENFFAVTCKSLKTLNASCNKLNTVSRLEFNDANSLEELLVSNNNLNENMFNILMQARKLRVLHAAYNKIGNLPETCLRNWPELEVLVLSGNTLQHLPDSISTLTKLQVLRVHSNLLLSTPALSKLSNLKVLDLAHNHLDRINLLNIMPKSLKYLDLSCNLQLQVDENQVKVCQSQKNWSLVDVSGKNRSSLPTNRLDDFKVTTTGGSNIMQPPWSLGFTETPGKCRKLLVSQLRLCNFHKDEALFGMFESEMSSAAAASLSQQIPNILQQERTIKETISEYMKYTLLSAHQKLAAAGELHEVGAALCHISKDSPRIKDYVRPQKTKKFVLRVASMGNIGAYVVRKTGNVCLTAALCDHKRLPGNSLNNAQNSFMFPDPEVTEVTLSNEDEFLVICNGNIWAVMDIDRVAREIRNEENVILAAKRIQDIAQSFGADENLSAIVVKFRNIGTDVDYLIKELKQTVRRKPNIVLPNVCKRTCCERNNACRHQLMEQQSTVSPQRQILATRSERSSPSGQSEQAFNPLLKDIDANDYILAHAHVLEEENEFEMLEETDSVLSEEQFKCWEYMLEQNTQLLFDKELNTISKSFTKNRVNERQSNPISDRLEYKTNLLKNAGSKLISNSSPQLLYSEVKKPFSPLAYQQQMSFLSKHFGSSRSFHASTASEGFNFFESKSRDSLTVGSQAKLSGGPNAAYFGSLQRLMPYNLEYDFAVTQERSILDDNDEYAEHESRIRKYWGVATTEL